MNGRIDYSNLQNITKQLKSSITKKYETFEKITAEVSSSIGSSGGTGSGGGGTHVYHWIENRALTNRERARLQTFPDDFIFHGSKESVRRQIGMAVPVDGVRYILEAILKTFADVKYESIESNLKDL